MAHFFKISFWLAKDSAFFLFALKLLVFFFTDLLLFISPPIHMWLGHFIRSLGKAGEKEVETEVLLFEHEIPSRPFSEKQLACLPPSDWCIVPENSMGRVDLRSILVCRF